MDRETRGYTLRELTDAAGVSARTVRYYIAEGLLPPPHGAGPASVYTEEHLERLRQIAALKAAYLPLKEIRRRLLGHGHDRGVVTETLAAAPPERGGRSSASAYLRELREREAGYEPDAPTVPSSPPAAPIPPLPSMAPEMDYPGPVRFPGAWEPDWTAPEVTWRRLPIDEEAELLISEDLYRRRRDKVDWLIEWARRVLRE